MKEKNLNLEKIILIADIVIGVIFIGLIIGLIIKGAQKPAEDIAKTEDKTEEKQEIDYTTEDDADADDSVTTRRYNAEVINDITTFMTAINNYQTNNRGSIPTADEDWYKFNRGYLETEFTNKYQFVHCDHKLGNCVLPETLTWKDNANIIYTALHASCNDKKLEYVTGNRKIAVYTHLKGETNGITCQNN